MTHKTDQIIELAWGLPDCCGAVIDFYQIEVRVRVRDKGVSVGVYREVALYAAHPHRVVVRAQSVGDVAQQPKGAWGRDKG